MLTNTEKLIKAAPTNVKDDAVETVPKTEATRIERANTKLRLQERVTELESELTAQKALNQKNLEQFNDEYQKLAIELNFNKESLKRLLHL